MTGPNRAKWASSRERSVEAIAIGKENSRAPRYRVKVDFGRKRVKEEPSGKIEGDEKESIISRQEREKEGERTSRYTEHRELELFENKRVIFRVVRRR